MSKSTKINKVTVGILGAEQYFKDEIIETYGRAGTNTETKKDHIDIDRVIKGKETKVQMIKIEGKSNKSGEAISLCHVALILFDLTNRQSFENILDNCILWLRDTCGFDRKILLIGFRPNDHPKVVKEKEISDLIEISSIQATYFDFSSADEDRKIALLDDTFYSETPQNLANESNSTKNCNIF